MKYNGIPTACETFSYGEVEDYTINIAGTGKGGETAVAKLGTTISLYPNPAETQLNIVNSTEKATYKVYSITGQELLHGIVANIPIDVSQLAQGNYLIQITDNEKATTLRFIKK
jgi:hypothetical protein